MENKNNSTKNEKEVKGASEVDNSTGKEIVEEIKEIDVLQGSNQHDENIVKVIVDGAVKKTEKDNERKIEIAKMEHETHKILIGVSERINIRKLELEAKASMVEDITNAVTWVAGVAGFATIAAIRVNAGKEIQLEKIRNGMID